MNPDPSIQAFERRMEQLKLRIAAVEILMATRTRGNEPSIEAMLAEIKEEIKEMKAICLGELSR